ncbi:autotransporter outer membrane beta-barrel domain-containing protein [Aureimonas altamirensis]|uniref:autotransporter outer membrane beta-barrel domain-containing protein n=1 Tax=Aureimonas altamirensis TaxID=370622 RepID=UPI0030165DC6
MPTQTVRLRAVSRTRPFLATILSMGFLMAAPAVPAHAQETSDQKEISGLVGAQVDIGRRFARVQSRRLHERMEVLRDATDRQTSGYSIRIGTSDGRADETALEREWRELDSELPAAYHVDDAPWRADRPDELQARRRFTDEGHALWSAGSVDFGRRTNGMIDLDRTSVGIASGFDAELSRQASLGMGLSFDRAIGEAGSFGTRARGQGLGAALYGSYNPTAFTFIDVAAGGSWMDFANARYAVDPQDLQYGSRAAAQGFGSVSAGYELRDDGFLLSPYGRFEVSHTRFDPMDQRIGETDLTLGEQTVDSVLAILAVRGEYTIELSNLVLKPGARAELTHEVSGASRVSPMAGGGLVLPDFSSAGIGREQLTVAPGIKAEFGDDWSAGLEYRNVLNNDGRDETISFRIGHSF